MGGVTWPQKASYYLLQKVEEVEEVEEVQNPQAQLLNHLLLHLGQGEGVGYNSSLRSQNLHSRASPPSHTILCFIIWANLLLHSFRGGKV